MNRLTGIKCASLVTALFTLTLCSVANARAQDSSGGAMGGLRGPQDIINSVNNRDSYGNPLPGSNATGAYGGDPGAAGGGDPAGSIHPFTPAGSYQGNPGGVPAGGAYLPPPTPGSYNGAPSPYQNGSTPFQGSNQPAPSYKHHHHHHQKNAAQSNQYQNQAQSVNQGPGGYPGQPGQYQNQYQYPQQDPSIASQTYPNAAMSGPPGATYAGNHKGSSGGNSSLGGAAVGVPDRAAKTAVGVSGKAAKEVLKALF